MPEQEVFYDFPDLPRAIFYWIVKDSEEKSKLTFRDIDNFNEKITPLNERTDVIMCTLYN